MWEMYSRLDLIRWTINKLTPNPAHHDTFSNKKKKNAREHQRGHKIFLGGISMDTKENDVKQYFDQYGTVLEVVFVVSKTDPSKPHKGFGFVTFEDESSVEQAIALHYHTINNKKCEAKKAESRENMSAMRGPNQYQGGQNQMNYNQGGPMGGGGNMGYNQGGQGGNWMGGGNQMMGGYGYGNQNFPTAYPQQYNSGSQNYGYGYGNQGYGQQQMGGNMGSNMGGNMGGNMQGYNNPAMMGGVQNNMGNAGQGGMRPQAPGNMGNYGNNYQQNQSGYGPMRHGGGDYGNMQGGGANNMLTGGGMGGSGNAANNMNNQSVGGNNAASGGGGGYGPAKSTGSSSQGYHPYRR
uniref:Heterogeneous nuclear ribonucleoproteins A2/B1-like n=1 Tax=Phallusia mammillata TaxID=59560 RepID=A0A6F9DDY6_9ASCI|nr:heterogeneous nuclear ribonucleoproteins A2/B1-like [Phallusia mammillata]